MSNMNTVLRNLRGRALTPAFLLISGFTPNVAAGQTVNAEVPVGKHYYTDTVNSAQNVTIFTNTANPKGIHLRTIVAGCEGNDALEAINPKGNSFNIGSCVPFGPSNIGIEQTYGIYLPAGWGLTWVVGAPSTINISYDQN
jgi:hypothetical protein